MQSRPHLEHHAQCKVNSAALSQDRSFGSYPGHDTKRPRCFWRACTSGAVDRLASTNDVDGSIVCLRVLVALRLVCDRKDLPQIIADHDDGHLFVNNDLDQCDDCRSFDDRARIVGLENPIVYPEETERIVLFSRSR